MQRDFIQLKPGYIHRPRIDRLLEKGLNYPLISVVAGPGYGKTLAVAGFARKAPMRVVWMRMQESDADIYRFWTHFTEAVGRELPELAEQLQKTALPVILGVYDVISQLIEKALEDGPPILIVLDSFESAASPPVIKLLQLLLKAELKGLHIVVISSEKLPIGGIAPSGGQLRISMEDLSFTEEEIGELFSAYGLQFTALEIRQIAENTGGWPLALHLICANQREDSAFTLKEKTHQQLAAELFERHYFSCYSEEMQRLLVALSGFERFPLELVKMLAGEWTDKALDKLSKNVFISYDYTLDLFQFQPMYRSFLCHLQALIPDQDKVRTQAFMGEWFGEHGYHFEALDCFFKIEDYQSYLLTLLKIPKMRRPTSQTSDVLQYLEKVPDAFKEEHPELLFCQAVMMLNEMQVEKARALLQSLYREVRGKPEQTEEDRLLLGDICVVLSDICMYLNETGALSYMKKAAEYLKGGCRIRTQDLMLVGNNNVFYLPSPDVGQLERAVDAAFAYATHADRVTNGSGYGLEWLFSAQAAFLTEQIEKAKENNFQAIAKAKTAQQHDIICNAYWELIRIELYRGDLPLAEQWLEALVSHVNTLKIIDLFELRDCALSWFYIRMGDYDQVASWVKSVAPIRSDNPLEVGRNRIIIIYYLTALGRHDEAYAEITLLEEHFRRYGRWHEKNLLLLHKAIRLLERKDRKEAIAAFKQAYDMVYPNQITGIFIEFGKASQRLIRAAKAQTEVAFDLSWLEMVEKKAGAFEKREKAMKKAYWFSRSKAPEAFNLNAREREILTYISQGMTRSEIALHLNTSLSNIKRYINNIYTKLGALNRADAIHIATLHGIIDRAQKHE